MSDSELPTGSPVHPQNDPLAETTVETPAEAPPAESGEQPASVKIGDQDYTIDQLETAIKGGMRQADYTRKTQDLAEQRKSLEAERAAWEEQRMAESPRETPRAEPSDLGDLSEYGPLGDAVQAIHRTQQEMAQAVKAQQEEREEASRVQDFKSRLQTNLDNLEGQPGFNRSKVISFMREHELQPEQAVVAYQAVVGPTLGEKLGEQKALSRLQTPAPMGAGDTSVSLGVDSPAGLPVADIDYANTSFEELATIAANDRSIGS